jgi:hypothetical protein
MSYRAPQTLQDYNLVFTLITVNDTNKTAQEHKVQDLIRFANTYTEL